jgi:hypothetical protein
MTRVYTIWPADRSGAPASTASAWRQDRSWLVLDVTEGLSSAHVVEGPVTRQEACRRELEIRATARRTKSRPKEALGL